MSDLNTTFQVLDRVVAPDLWQEVEARAGSDQPGAGRSGRRRRLLAGAIGLVVAVAAMGTGWVALHGLGHPIWMKS